MVKNISKKALSILLLVAIVAAVFLSAIPTVGAASSMKTGDAGINLIKTFEGFSKYKYWDYSQWSIGYGSHCDADDYPDGITEGQAVALLKSQLSQYEGYVNTFLNKYRLTVNQNQFDAMVSFTYNLGNVWITSDNFTLRNYFLDGIEKYSSNEIAAAFGLWCKAGGEVIPGLVNRRAAEAALFCKPYQQYTITYNASGGNGAPSPVTVSGGQTFYLSSSTPTRSGYKFLGWTADSGNTTRADYLPGAAFTASSNVTLYAVWQKTYTILYHANGGINAPAETIKPESTDVRLSSNSPVRTGYKFIGWSKDPYAEEASYSSGGYYTENTDTVLFAVWQRYITVALDPTGGIFPGPDGVLLGDVNGDEAIDAEDIMILSSILSDGTNIEDAVKKASDLNLDNVINNLDLIILEDYVSETLSSLPAICIPKNSFITSVPIPVMEGKFFHGWIGQGDFILASGANTDSVENAVPNTLYAVWGDTPMQGDVDNDSKVTVSDVVRLRAIIMSGSCTKQEFDAGNMDQDDSITVSDVVALRTYIIKGA